MNRLWNRIKECMLRHPKQEICDGAAVMTYEEAVIYAELFAERLRGQACCGILCQSEMAAALALLACLAAGVTAVPISLRYGDALCRSIIDTISPSALITDTYNALQIAECAQTKYKPPKHHPALIMCTSGTTGKPKGVMLSEQNILANLKDIAEYFSLDYLDRILITRPLYHCAVLTGEFLTALLKGLYIRFYSDRFNPKQIMNLIETHQITTVGGTPTTWKTIARFKRNLSACPVRTIIVSGECMSCADGQMLARAFPKASVYHVYGMTEASPRISALPPEMFHQYPNSVGFPLRCVSIKITKKNGCLARPGEAGVLWVRGPNVMLGYYNNSPYTKRVIKNGWLCTGDIALQDKKGLLYIKGRKDDMIIRAGMNIYPQEIEAALKADPCVHEAMAYGYTSNATGTQIGLKIVGDFPNVDAVRHLCLNILPPFQIPSKIELVTSLPKNPSGKIIRRKPNA